MRARKNFVTQYLSSQNLKDHDITKKLIGNLFHVFSIDFGTRSSYSVQFVPKYSFPVHSRLRLQAIETEQKQLNSGLLLFFVDEQELV